jgi:hypothetical protein
MASVLGILLGFLTAGLLIRILRRNGASLIGAQRK